MICKNYIVLLFVCICCTACHTKYPNQSPLKQSFPIVQGKSLDGKTWNIPKDFKAQPTLLLVGYVQKSQFDIDRWLIGLDMYDVQVQAFELPCIEGLFPKMFKSKINAGMRRGIPKFLWKGVITIYQNSERILKFTGNENPNNARVILLDHNGKVVDFHDEGFSVQGLKALKTKIDLLKSLKKQTHKND